MGLRVIVAGLGERGRLWARTVRDHPAFELIGGADPVPSAAELAVRETGLSPDRCFGSLDEALDRQKPDAVVIATPEDRHIEPVTEALSRRIPVLVEKPLTLRLADSLELVHTAEHLGVPLLVAQNYRYMRAHRTVRRLIREDALGRVGMIVAQYYRPDHRMAPSLVNLRNRILYGPTVHHLDAIRWCLGRDATRVSARLSRLPWGEEPPGATVQTMIEFEDIRLSYVATYESSGHEFFEGGQEFYERVVGERATLHVFQRWLFLCERGKLPRPIRRGSRPVTEQHILLDQLERAIRAGEEPECSGRNNLGTMAMIEAILRSSDEHCAIDPRSLLP